MIPGLLSRTPSTCEVSTIRGWGAIPSRLPEAGDPVLAGSATREPLVFPADHETKVCSASTEQLITLTPSPLWFCAALVAISSAGRTHTFGHLATASWVCSHLGEIMTERRTEGNACSPPLWTGLPLFFRTILRSAVSILREESHPSIAYTRRCSGDPERVLLEWRADGDRPTALLIRLFALFCAFSHMWLSLHQWLIGSGETLPREITVPSGPKHPNCELLAVWAARPVECCLHMGEAQAQNSWVSEASMGPKHSVQTLDMLEPWERNPSSCFFSTAVFSRMCERGRFWVIAAKTAHYIAARAPPLLAVFGQWELQLHWRCAIIFQVG